MMGTRPRHAYVYVYVYVYMVVPYLQGARISRFGLGHTTVYVYAYVYELVVASSRFGIRATIPKKLAGANPTGKCNPRKTM
jgi:hypothetical protein